MAKKKLIKSGDRTHVVTPYGEITSIVNRVPNEEANFAMTMIEKWALGVGRGEVLMKPEEAVERAFKIARLTFQHIKDNRMDTPFPFAKVYSGEDA